MKTIVALLAALMLWSGTAARRATAAFPAEADRTPGEAVAAIVLRNR